MSYHIGHKVSHSQSLVAQYHIPRCTRNTSYIPVLRNLDETRKKLLTGPAIARLRASLVIIKLDGILTQIVEFTDLEASVNNSI